MNIQIKTSDRKAFVKMLVDLTGEQSHYLGMPTRNFQVGCYTIDPDCRLLFDRDEKNILPTLKQKKLIDESFEIPEETPVAREEENDEEPTEIDPDSPFPMKINVSVPLTNHTGESLRQLVYFIYGREEIFNKAVNGNFHVNEGFLTVLADNENALSVTNFLSAKEAFESEHGVALTGIEITEDKITYSGFGEVNSAEEANAYNTFAAKINEYAISSRRILPKKAKTTESEKYDMRNILVRMGMDGKNYKAERKILMSKLSGESAFPNRVKYLKWKAVQDAKLAVKRAAKAEAEQPVNTGTDTQDKDSEAAE